MNHHTIAYCRDHYLNIIYCPLAYEHVEKVIVVYQIYTVTSAFIFCLTCFITNLPGLFVLSIKPQQISILAITVK